MWNLKEKIGKGKNTVSFEMIAVKSNTCNIPCYILCDLWYVVLFNFQIFWEIIFFSMMGPNWWVGPSRNSRRPVRSNGSHLQWCGRMRRKFAHFLFSTTFLLQIRMEVVWLVKQSCPWWCILLLQLWVVFTFFFWRGGGQEGMCSNMLKFTHFGLNHCWTTFFYTAQLSSSAWILLKLVAHCHQVEERWGRHILLPWLSSKHIRDAWMYFVKWNGYIPLLVFFLLHTVDTWNPADSPVEVGSLIPLLTRFF